MNNDPRNSDSFRAFQKTQRAIRPVALGILFGLGALIVIVLLTGNWPVAIGALVVIFVAGLLLSTSRSISALKEAESASQEPEEK